MSRPLLTFVESDKKLTATSCWPFLHLLHTWSMQPSKDFTELIENHDDADDDNNAILLMMMVVMMIIIILTTQLRHENAHRNR